MDDVRTAASFTGPICGRDCRNVDGNAPANRVAKSATLTVTINAGQEIWLRQDPDDSGNDHGLAIDDFSVTATGAGDSAPAVTTRRRLRSDQRCLDSNIVINFSESATAAPGAFTVQCPVGTPEGFTITAHPPPPSRSIRRPIFRQGQSAASRSAPA